MSYDFEEEDELCPQCEKEGRTDWCNHEIGYHIPQNNYPEKPIISREEAIRLQLKHSQLLQKGFSKRSAKSIVKIIKANKELETLNKGKPVQTVNAATAIHIGSDHE